MPDLDWEFDDGNLLLRLTYRGTLRLDRMPALWDVLRSLDHDPTEINTLVDTREADLSELTVADFKEMEARRQRGEIPMGRVAAVVGSDLDLGIGRLWAALRNESAPGSTAVFSDEPSALAWLLGSETAASE